jgi:hypothetical protein
MNKKSDADGKASAAFPAARLLAAALCVAAVLFFALVPLVPAVAARDVRTGRLGAALPVGVGGGFMLTYIHSVNKGAVFDEFLVGEDGSLTMKRSVFQSFGAGMSDGLEPGVVMRTTKDGVELSGMNRKIGTLRLAVGTVADHRLRGAGKAISLAERFGPGTPVSIAYQRIALFEWIRERIRNGREQRNEDN